MVRQSETSTSTRWTTLDLLQQAVSLRRVPEVMDCWFEPVDAPLKLTILLRGKGIEEGFPADFIAEGLDQTRGWFYTLMVLSTALLDKPAANDRTDGIGRGRPKNE